MRKPQNALEGETCSDHVGTFLREILQQKKTHPCLAEDWSYGKFING
jgi:hypothetical protein